jgi:protein KRI1
MVRDEIMKKMDDDNNDQSNNDDDNDKNDNAYDRDSDYVSTRDNVHKLAYDEEQVNLRSAFLNDDDDDDDSNNDDTWLKKKSNKNNTSDDQIEKDRLEEIANLTATTNTATSSADNSTKLQDPKGEVEDGEEFLFDFIKNKRWVDHDTFDYNDDEEEGARYPATDEYDKGNDSDASLNDLNKTDEFESRYNFRFEEANNTGTESGAGLSVVGYARSSLSDTIRRKDESRKMKRKQRKERKMEERKAKEEKLKRLKNAKREELEERISQVKGVLSDKTSEIPDDTVNEELVAKLMDGDFDPDKFEDLMSKMYDDNYYEQEDGDWKNDSDVKQSLMKSGLQEDKEIITELEDREGEDFHDDVEEYDAGQEDFGEDDQDGVYDEEAEYQEDYQDEKKVENVLDKKLNDRMMDELYKLDYEDIIGDMPTRFKYRKVQSNRYGLRPEEILFSRDTTLKQFVSLKRMAPYEEEGEYLPGTKRRKRFREMAKADLEEIMRESEKTDSSAILGNDIESTEQPEKKKRRRQKKGKKKKNQLEDTDVTTDQTKDQIENSIDTKTKQENDPTPTKTKGRKKKGKKIKKNSKTDCLGGKKEKSSDKSNSKRSDSKRKSKKEDGISESRLASYTF